MEYDSASQSSSAEDSEQVFTEDGDTFISSETTSMVDFSQQHSTEEMSTTNENVNDSQPSSKRERRKKRLAEKRIRTKEARMTNRMAAKDALSSCESINSISNDQLSHSPDLSQTSCNKQTEFKAEPVLTEESDI